MQNKANSNEPDENVADKQGDETALPSNVDETLVHISVTSELDETTDTTTADSVSVGPLSKQFGRYRINRKLGQGGMGAVYLARDTQLDRNVALKVPFLRNEGTEVIDRFYREARAMATLHHPNLCTVHDVGEIDGVHYLTMAFVEGHPLQADLESGKPLPARQVATLVRKIAIALQEAHQANIVHRDLKPANIMIDKRNEPIVMDFGLAQRQIEGEIELTQTGSLIGSPNYMSPEQVQGNQEKVGPQTDVYSLGVIMYRMLCGRLPFEGSMASVLGKIALQSPALPREIHASVDPQLETICLIAMAKPLKDRYQSAREFATALEKYLSSTSTAKVEPTAEQWSAATASKDTLAPVSPARHLRRPVVLFALALVIVVAVLGIGMLVRNKVGNEAAEIQVPNGDRAELIPADDATAGKAWHGWPTDAPAPAIAPFGTEQANAHQQAWARYLGVPVEYTNSIGMKFRLIPPGEFLMGSTPAEIVEALQFADDLHEQECVKSEAPQRKVVVTKPIYLGVHEVTQQQYETLMGTNPSWFAKTGLHKQKVADIDTANHPVDGVLWNDAVEFSVKLSEKEMLRPCYARDGETTKFLDGIGYRLPTEAEWEFSCRAGTTTKFWVGETDEALVRIAWFDSNSSKTTHAVGGFEANPFGLSDMHGNVWEWCQEWWEPTGEEQPSERLAVDLSVLPFADAQRVYRGGSWRHSGSHCRCSHRHAFRPPVWHDRIGFRMSLSIDAVVQAMK